MPSTGPAPPPFAVPPDAFVSLSSAIAVERQGSGLDLHQVLKHLVGRLNRLRVRLEALLMRNEIHELRRDVDVRLFERTRNDRAAATTAGGTERGIPRRDRRGPKVLSDVLKAVVVV